MPAVFSIRACVLALGAAILFGGVACAQTETLQDALTQAYNTNPQLLSERAHLRAVDENVPQALANWRPTVQFEASGGTEPQWNSGPPPLFFPPFQQLLPTIVDLQVSQPLYRGGRTIAQTAQAEKTVAAERAKLVVTEETVLYSVIQYYLDVVRDQATVDLAINNEQLLGNSSHRPRKQFRVGTVTRTDVAQAEAQYAGGGRQPQPGRGQSASQPRQLRARGRPFAAQIAAGDAASGIADDPR